jgi:hypothetical protein
LILLLVLMLLLLSWSRRAVATAALGRHRLQAAAAYRCGVHATAAAVDARGRQVPELTRLHIY